MQTETDLTKLISTFRNCANAPESGNRISTGLLKASRPRAACRVGHIVLQRAGQPSADGGGHTRVEPAALRAALHTTSHGNQPVRGSLRRRQGLLPGP